MKQIRKSVITREELIADVIFLFISSFISFALVFLFDVHHSFYERPIYPFKFIFKTHHPYLLFISLGTIVGFLLIKLFLFALREKNQ